MKCVKVRPVRENGRPEPIILTIINGDILSEIIQLEYKNICT